MTPTQSDDFLPGATGPGGESVSVGIVIPLPDPLRSILQRLRSSFGDPVARSVDPHITLVTGARTPDWAAARTHVRRVAERTAAFTIGLRGTASFRPVSPVVYLRVEAGFSECVGLHRELQAGPLDQQPEFAYHPHLTIAHDIGSEQMDRAQDTLTGFEADFPVDRIGLFEHDADGLWALQEELILGQAGQAPS